MVVAIAHIAHWKCHLGGAEYQLELLTELLINKGYQVHVIVPTRNCEKVVGKGYTLHYLKNNHPKTWLGKIWFVNIFKLFFTIKSIKPNYVITRSHSSWPGILSIFASYLEYDHKHFIASDGELLTLKGARLMRLFDLIEQIFYTRLFLNNSQIFAQNTYQQKIILQKYDKHCSIVTQRGINSDINWSKKSEEVVKVVWIGNLKYVKAPGKFIDIARAFQDENRVEFVMAGAVTGEYDTQFLKEAENFSNFNYIGKVSNSTVNNLLEKAHVFINTSYLEGFPNTFVQAWIRGVIVLSLNVDPSFILSSSSHSAVLGSVENLIFELRRIIDRQDELASRCRLAREYALSNHVLDNDFLLEIDLMKERNE